MAALSKLVRDSAPLGIKLGAPPAAALLGEFGPKEWEQQDFQRWRASLLAMHPSSEVYRIRALGSDPAQPVESIEITTVLDLSIDREKVLADAGVARTAWAGQWSGIFRPVKGELYGDHVFGLTEVVDAYESTLPGIWLLVDSTGAFYGFVRASSLSALRTTGLMNTPADVALVIEDDLARGNVVAAHDLALKYGPRAGASLASVVQAAESAYAERNARLGAEAEATFAEWKQRFDARPQGDETAVRALLVEIAGLSQKFERIEQAAPWSGTVRRELAEFSRERAAADRFRAHSSVWASYGADGAFSTQEIVTALALADALEALKTAEEVRENANGMLPYTLPSHVREALRASLPAVFAERHRREVGSPNEGTAVRALALAMAESGEMDPVYYAAQRMKDAQALDQALQDYVNRPSMVGHLLGKLSAPLEGLNETRSWATFRAQVPALVRAEFVRRAELAQQWNLPATAASHWLSAAMVTRAAFPEPERLVDVLAHGSRDPDPLVANARNALAPLVARRLPPLHATVAYFERLEQLFRRSPIAEFAAFWQLGLSLESVADLREATRLADGGNAPPWVQVVSDGVERLRIADVADAPAPTPPELAFAWLGLDLPPEMREEKAWIDAEKAAIDNEQKRINELQAAYNAASESHRQDAETFRVSIEKRLPTVGKAALEAEARALDERAARLNEENASNNATVRAFNARIQPFNERVTRYNDRYYFLLGDKTAQLDVQLNDAFARWQAEHLPAPPEVTGYELRSQWTRTEATLVAEWLKPGDSPLPYDLRGTKRPSFGMGNAVIAELERSLWMQAGAKGIGEQLGLLLARDLQLTGSIRASVSEALGRYRARFGAAALREHLLTGRSITEQYLVLPALPADVRTDLGR
ncbi:MAG: hypothetical protein NTV21_10985 [Planctomycetota bacterium]|nr:hypothetical protein [Planctomycetota bacterium]